MTEPTRTSEPRDITLADLAALREKATPGPWTQTGTKAKPHWYVSAPDVLVHGPRMDQTDMATTTYERWNADAAFIAAAGSFDYAATAARIEALEAALRYVDIGLSWEVFRQQGASGEVRDLRATIRAALGDSR